MQISTPPPRANKSTKPKINYVNNQEFLQALIEYKALVKTSEENNTPPPNIPNYIGVCLSQIANRLATKVNFVNYSYRDEMVSDGIENCIIYLHNFDPEKSSNPFAYFTQIIYFAFLRRIQREKKQTYVKHKVFERDVIHMGLVEHQVDEGGYSTVSNSKLDSDYINTFVEDFEQKLAIKSKKIDNIARDLEKELDNNENE